MAELAGKAALVTGAGVGIGRAIALKMASEGARVMVVDLNEETAEETAALICDAGGEAIVFTADVSDDLPAPLGHWLAVVVFGLSAITDFIDG